MYFLDCPNGFTYYPHTRKCYQFFDESPTWQEARKKCISEGGDLASVPDQKTNDFLLSISPKGSLIGGYMKTDSLDSWTWTDGTTWTFTNWLPGEPWNKDEKWLWLTGLNEPKKDRQGKWNNGYSSWTSGTYGFICQI